MALKFINFAQKRHGGGCSGGPHDLLALRLAANKQWFAGLTVCGYSFYVNGKASKRLIIKWKILFREVPKTEVEIIQPAAAQQTLWSGIGQVFVLDVDAVYGPSDLPGDKIDGIARSNGHADHMGKIDAVFHQDIQHTRRVDSSHRAARTDQACLIYHNG